MKINLSISPCPNDTFMFDAMLNGRTGTGGLSFATKFADIEQLNLDATNGIPDVTKVSFAVLPDIIDKYAVLSSGSALGRGNGPLLITRKGRGMARPDEPVAVPGLKTTACSLMKRLFPDLGNLVPVLFSEIADRVIAGEFAAGVLIHEGRFTYREQGLTLLADLGTEWENRTGLPLPLGAIAVSRGLDASTAGIIDRTLRGSIEYAFDHPLASRQFVKSHARELDDKVIESHIELFVNRHSLALGEDGIRAVELLTGCGRNDFMLKP